MDGFYAERTARCRSAVEPTRASASVLVTQEGQMTSKTDFTDDDWTQLKRAPFVAAMAISLADPGGPIELYHETSAALKSVREAVSGGHGALVGAIAADAMEDARQHKSPLGGFKPSKGAMAGAEILQELGAVNEIVSQKAAPNEAGAVREWLLATAQDAANAAKEGRVLRLPRRTRQPGREGHARPAGRGAGRAGLKVNPRSEYPVRVRPLGLEYDASIAELYAGAYQVALNSMVEITFVPDLGPDAPPYDRSRLPENLDEVGTREEARLEAVLYADCAVTPNARLAGTNEPLPKPPWALEHPPGVVVYVTHEEFEHLAVDLELLAPDLGISRASRRRSRSAHDEPRRELDVRGLARSPLEEANQDVDRRAPHLAERLTNGRERRRRRAPRARCRRTRRRRDPPGRPARDRARRAARRSRSSR